MKKILLLVLAFLFLNLKSNTNDISVDYDKLTDRVVFYATNNTKYPLTISIQVTCTGFMQNRYSDAISLEPYEKKTRLLTMRRNGDRYQFSYKTNFRIGNMYHSRHDKNHVYQLPFKGSVYIMQGYNGKFSHKHKKALDFFLPYYSKVFAARGGKVLKIVDWNTKGCPNKSCINYANYILIEHEDGTIAQYYHLSPKSVVVKEGQIVKTGDFIAKSGNTGWSSGPHLHFEVYESRSFSKKTVKTLFNINGEAKHLNKGVYEIVEKTP